MQSRTFTATHNSPGKEVSYVRSDFEDRDYYLFLSRKMVS